MGTTSQIAAVFGLLILTTSFALADDSAKEQSLADAVKTFNEKALRSRIGKVQPPLTEDEVIAAILGWKNEQPKASKAYYDVIQKVAHTRTLPPNANLSFFASYSDGKGYHFDVWWIDISIEKKVDRFEGYGYRLREKWLRARPTTPFDAQLIRLFTRNRG